MHFSWGAVLFRDSQSLLGISIRHGKLKVNDDEFADVFFPLVECVRFFTYFELVLIGSGALWRVQLIFRDRREYRGATFQNQTKACTMDAVENEFGIAGVKKYFSIGDIIAKMGDQADAWYILLSGKVGVFKRDFSVAEISDRGTVFGELGCLLNIPRTATLQALEPTSVLYVQMSMDDVVEKYPQFAKRILVSLAERLAKTTDAWWASAQQKE